MSTEWRNSAKCGPSNWDRIIPDTASAEFFLLFGPGSRVEELKFASGSEKLKAADKVLSSATFEIRFPDDGRGALYGEAC